MSVAGASVLIELSFSRLSFTLNFCDVPVGLCPFPMPSAILEGEKVANSVGIGPVFCFGRMSCCRLDSTFFVWIALFPKVIFFFILD